MWKRLIALVVSLAIPAAAMAGPLKEAADKAGRELAQQQADTNNGRGRRFWSGIGLIAGGAVLGVLGSVEIGDDETGPDDGEDVDDSDDGEDSDGWGNKALIGGGIAAATVGGVLLLTGKKGPQVSASRQSFSVRHTIRF